jgi:hypothetical protein
MGEREGAVIPLKLLRRSRTPSQKNFQRLLNHIKIHCNNKEKLVGKGGDRMFLTIKAKIHCDSRTKSILKYAMFCSTKVYNGLLWHLRKEYEETGKLPSLGRI